MNYLTNLFRVIAEKLKFQCYITELYPWWWKEVWSLLPETKICISWNEKRILLLRCNIPKLEPIYFEIKGYLRIYTGYYMIIRANEFYLWALMMSIRNERSDRMRDITNTRKLLTRPKTTCQSKVSFTLCKRMIKHSSQAKKSPERAHYDV